MTPDMTRLNQNNNFIVFGCVNTIGYRPGGAFNVPALPIEVRKVIPMCVRFNSDKVGDEHVWDKWVLECYDLDKQSYRTFAFDDLEPR